MTTTPPLKRDGKADGLTPAAISVAFTLAKGAAAHADNGKGARVLFKVDAIDVPPPPEKAEADKLAGEIGQQLSEDFASQYLAALHSRYGATINQDALNRAAGRGQQ